MGILLEPKDSNDKLLEFLKDLMGEDGLAFLDLDNAITAVKPMSIPIRPSNIRALANFNW